MKIKDLKSAYSNLQLIVFRNKYLIPQKPKIPTALYCQYVKQTWRLIKLQGYNISSQQFDINRKFQYKGMKTIHQQIKTRIQNNDENLILIKHKYQQQMKQHKQKVLKYNQQYLQPLAKMRACAPIPCYLKNNSKQCKQKNIKFNFAQVMNKWRQLPQQQKKAIYQQSQNQKLKYLQTFNSYLQKHQIPYYKICHGLKAFLSQHQKIQQYQHPYHDQQHTQSSYLKYQQLYNNLKQSQKQKYLIIAQQINQKSKIRFIKFLNSWNLTQNQLSYIHQICQNYHNLSQTKNKKLIKALLSQGQLQTQISQDLIDSLQTPQNSQNTKKNQ